MGLEIDMLVIHPDRAAPVVDVQLLCLRHLAEALPDRWDAARHPALAAHSAAAEALPVFREISQPFVGPSGS